MVRWCEALSESALSEGTPPVGPWRGVCVSACDIPRALRSRSSVRMESPPHDNPSSLAGEGFNSPSRKRAHFTSTKGSKARKAQVRGEKEPHRHITADVVEYRVGAFPYPFRGHEVACKTPTAVVGPTAPHGTIILPQAPRVTAGEAIVLRKLIRTSSVAPQSTKYTWPRASVGQRESCARQPRRRRVPATTARVGARASPSAPSRLRPR
eukprot:scaffold32301_cov135-Isochrysis_galbana.AAC.5